MVERMGGKYREAMKKIAEAIPPPTQESWSDEDFYTIENQYVPLYAMQDKRDYYLQPLSGAPYCFNFNEDHYSHRLHRSSDSDDYEISNIPTNVCEYKNTRGPSRALEMLRMYADGRDKAIRFASTALTQDYWNKLNPSFYVNE